MVMLHVVFASVFSWSWTSESGFVGAAWWPCFCIYGDSLSSAHCHKWERAFSELTKRERQKKPNTKQNKTRKYVFILWNAFQCVYYHIIIISLNDMWHSQWFQSGPN